MTDDSRIIYKALGRNLRAANGGDYRYPGVGRWTKHLDGDLEPCSYGYHLAVGPQVLNWLSDTLYEAEPCPDHEWIDDGDKFVTCWVRLVRKLNWDERVARLFAADCAEAALLGERGRGREPDARSWAAVEAARAYARGEIGAAAQDAARAAAWAAAGAARAARTAAWAAQAAACAAQAAAWAAAWAAAGDARAAAGAAWDAARAAQYRRFEVYVTGGTPGPVEALY